MANNNNNQILVTSSRNALDQLKNETASELGIQNYAQRANRLETSDTLLMIDRRQDIKKAMIKAGYVYKSYVDYDPGSRSSETFIVDGKVVTDPRMWRLC